jgi:dTDP-4-dehydrorhamnose reductase
MKKILLTGKNGQVGWELCRTLMPLGEVISVDVDELNLADATAIRKVVRDVKPAIIVNPAAYTAVDKAESESELALAINGTAPGVLAEEAERLGSLLVHYSTDYIFDGTKPSAYAEEDAPNPLGVYGATKLAGEEAIRAAGCKHLILRTSWVYGARGNNFMLTMLRLAKERRELRIVNDQTGAPTWCRSLAEITALILAQLNCPNANPAFGTYHLTSSGSVSWFDFAVEILRMAKVEPLPRLIPIPTSEYPLQAQRPANSVLSNGKLLRAFNLAAGDWKENLRLCLESD